MLPRVCPNEQEMNGCTCTLLHLNVWFASLITEEGKWEAITIHYPNDWWAPPMNVVYRVRLACSSSCTKIRLKFQNGWIVQLQNFGSRLCRFGKSWEIFRTVATIIVMKDVLEAQQLPQWQCPWPRLSQGSSWRMPGRVRDQSRSSWDWSEMKASWPCSEGDAPPFSVSLCLTLSTFTPSMVSKCWLGQRDKMHWKISFLLA